MRCLALVLWLAGAACAQTHAGGFLGGPGVIEHTILLDQAAARAIPRPAPPLTVDWLGAVPPLAGKVLLVRFWTVDCELCSRSAPAIEDLHQRYGPQGLVVLGVHHTKRRHGVSDSVVLERAKRLGMTFPIGQDRKWKTVDAWWPPPRELSSATVLVDRHGQIRFVHPGGEFQDSQDPKHERCKRDREQVEAWVRQLIAER